LNADLAIARAKRDNDAAINQAERDYLRAMASIVPPITPPTPAAVLPVSGLPVALPAPACPPADGAGGALYHDGETT
jgi:hypothetical protein